MALCKTFPPIEIFDMLHRLEELGGVVDPLVDEWWENETAAQESGTQTAQTNNNAKG